MAEVIVITPVKNSLDTTLDTARAIAASTVPVRHIIFNDFSTVETKAGLEAQQADIGYELVHLEDHTDHPSPNYKLVLQMTHKLANEAQLPFIVVESDVVVEKNTIEVMLKFQEGQAKSGLVGAVTVDEGGVVNFPYLKFKGVKEPVIDTSRSLSFCCTLFSRAFLEAYDFAALDEAKDWYDTFISKKSIELGFKNHVLMNSPVWHRPHASRPWKQLKYSNPLKYYFLKFWKGMDKI
ncbi:glycosyltransferase family 2 protein [Algoriphagus halophytocola]|uniref:Glycosyltransferase family 2 protein n=1 Tax=Algoriphagus halophytocola TaxID=2991499 RepID=A0ABY6MIH6_9BACT|nr:MULTISPECIES: glycosyltransferase family 2 protein [unclassified Algoriphagus]UZD22222.1 glycosyltransferase family 2 protein [Algoriphagus sp. TR-M5]WBL43472.1 glycosyltransferase family 2 protein [Algoriphagus sp. TR-M9]